MNCRELTQVIARDELSSMSFMRHLDFRVHMILCPPCRLYARQVRALGDAVRRFLGVTDQGDSEVYDDLERRIIRNGLSRGGTGSGSPTDPT